VEQIAKAIDYKGQNKRRLVKGKPKQNKPGAK
jgi:hypothetical protein